MINTWTPPVHHQDHTQTYPGLKTYDTLVHGTVLCFSFSLSRAIISHSPHILPLLFMGLDLQPTLPYITYSYSLYTGCSNLIAFFYSILHQKLILHLYIDHAPIFPVYPVLSRVYSSSRLRLTLPHITFLQIYLHMAHRILLLTTGKSLKAACRSEQGRIEDGERSVAGEM